MVTTARAAAVLALAVFAAGVGVLADAQRPEAGPVVQLLPATIEQRAAGAERVVVASVEAITADYETNEFGDRLIVSHARLKVEEAIKGPSEPLTLDYDGGTVDGITLHVSSQSALQPGDRAVFFVTRGRRGEFRPHLQGQGVLKLDARNHVPRSSLTLDDVRRMAGGKDR